MNMQQTQGQPPGHQHIASSSSNGDRRGGGSWQVESLDVPERRNILENILRLFQRRKGTPEWRKETPEWQQRLPEMVKRLEESLYRDAATKEEYKDLSTLEQRLQSVAKRLNSNRVAAVAAAASSAPPVRNAAPAGNPRNPTMIPTPGAPTMIPTPGLAATGPSLGTPNPFVMPSSRRNTLAVSLPASTPNSLVSHSGTGGIRMVQNAQHTSSGMVTSGQMNGHFYHNDVGGKGELLNGRINSPFIGNSQYSLDGNAMHTSSSYFGQGQIQRERFQIHKPHTGDLCQSKMIPVPGLPSQMLQQLQSEAQEQSQRQAAQQRQLNQKKAEVVRGQNGTDSLSPLQCADMSQPSTSSSTDGANGVLGPNGTLNTSKEQAVKKQRSWLCLLRHANTCTAPEGQCTVTGSCATARRLLLHATKCREGEGSCTYAHCYVARALLKHHYRCQSAQCPVCAPVRHRFRNSPSPIPSSTEEAQFPAKRVKEEVDDHANATNNGTNEAGPVVKKVKLEPVVASVQQRSPALGKSKGQVQIDAVPKLEDGKESIAEAHSSTLENAVVLKHEPESAVSKPCDMASKSGKSKVVGISLIELFTSEQIREHISSLRLWIGQSKAKAERNQAMEHQMSENACRLCAVERLTFEPPPLYCTTCGARIKRNLTYYTAGSGETKHYFCVACHNSPADTVDMDGQTYPKSKLEKKKNDEETEEAWVQCDKCNLWQHQICALFNGRRNEGGDAEYICPQCLINEMDSGERRPLPSTSVLGAKDLPRTQLSDHLEQRLARRLKQERSERAKAQGKSPEEVPGAEGLVVRVVSSVDKKLEVKQRFLEIFKDSDYPSEYLYKSKVLLLFQRIEGVEVCLFGMYVQEFGAECPQPNNRRLYIAYLDSVKYFRPEVKTVTGEALRTFVYHEILIGYLDYCKRRGFGSCYIWACPPLRGEDYILYCHPEIQKTPKSDKLREWYLSMLAKATKENIVVELTNFYDYFFISPDECKAHVTAARLPYFDGDYWPGAAEDILLQLQQEEEERSRQRRGIGKKGLAKRVGVQTEMVSNASKDLQLMSKLGQAISPMKEDFIMVHMHHSCRHCRLFITSGSRWVCKQCKNFQLCNRCYVADQKLDEKDRHPWNCWESHELFSVEVSDVPADTRDKDEIMESEFFDTRQAFLSLCQGNHYQHDTLRRAKHSSMMVLYHLHNPTAPAFVTSCNLCNQEIETGKGWRCDICTDFDVCAGCFPKELPRHPHKLKPQLSKAERDAQNKEARQQRVLQLRKMLELLVHSSQCCAAQCQYPKCRNVKNLFRHGTTCRTRASGGCALCKMMWHLLQLHARACKEADCRVPRCKDLKEHLRRSQLQSESRRRAAVKEMIRQRSSDIASSAS